MDSKNNSRTLEDEFISDQDGVIDSEIESDEAPPAYNSLSPEDLPLSPSYSIDKRQSIFLEGMGEKQASPRKEYTNIRLGAHRYRPFQH